jgi:hypothetical protein
MPHPNAPERAVTIIDHMRGEVRRWLRSGKEPTHWLLSDEASLRLLYETRHQDWLSERQDTPKFEGYPIYRWPVTGTLGEHGFELRDGEPPDYSREQELRRQLHLLRVEYQERAKPLVDELVKIENRKPPRPIVVPVDAFKSAAK